MIDVTSIYGINVERFGYIFCYIKQKNVNILIGRMFEQENDAGERQYVYEIYQDAISDELLYYIVLPGIDLTTRETVYIRSGETPYFVECSVPPRRRGDVKRFLGYMKMEYYDEFEYMLRSRAITHHTNCYLGRTPVDFFDNPYKAMMDRDFWFDNLPNLNETPENVFHRAERVFKDVHYCTSIE